MVLELHAAPMHVADK